MISGMSEIEVSNGVIYNLNTNMCRFSRKKELTKNESIATIDIMFTYSYESVFTSMWSA